MASRRFFAYDPDDYYYATPYHYPYPYYHQHRRQKPAAPTRRTTSGFFPVAADADHAAVGMAAADPAPRARSVSIPVHFVGSDTEPERELEAAGLRAEPVARMATAPRKQAPSAEAAAVRVQASARGFLARKSVRAVREVEREAEEAQKKVEREAEALRVDARARIAVGEALMRLLLRLDAVRGAREYRRRVTKLVLALQDAVDALEPKAAPEPAEESAAAQELPEVEGHGGLQEVECRGGETESQTVVETPAKMEMDGETAAGDLEEKQEREQAPGDANLDADDRTEGADAESGEWEMVTEEPEAATTHDAPTQQEAAEGKEVRGAAETGATDGGPDAKRLMEMVVALCERSAQQCAVIGALAERVDALECAVRRVEDAERRRRRAQKLRKEGKGSNRGRCYSDRGFAISQFNDSVVIQRCF